MQVNADSPLERTPESATEHPLARAELSLEISRQVSRVVKGEAVDTAACGEELAQRFPQAGMSADMIAEAIVSAAGMVGMIRGDGEAQRTDTDVSAAGDHLLDEGAVAAAIDAEIGELTAGETTAQADVNGAARADDGGAAETASSRTADGFGFAAFAAVRRAFLRR